MGEARRRKAITPDVRYAGSLTDYMREHKRSFDVDAAGERAEAATPCNGCTSCCYAKKIVVNPEQENPDDVLHLDLVRDTEGHFTFRRQESGACVHLSESGCSVHKHRPRVCRMYDCRLGGVSGVVQCYDDRHHSPKWLFSGKNHAESDMIEKLQHNARQFLAEHPDRTAEDAVWWGYDRLVDDGILT